MFPLSLTLLVATATAQGYEPDYGVLAPRAGFAAGVGDDVLFDLQPMNITFPMGGVAASYTYAHIQSNGVMFLTTGAVSGGTTSGYSTSTATQLSNLQGLAFEPPRIAPMWRDLDMLAANGGGVFFNNTIPGKFVATWMNAVQYGTTAPIFTLQVQLFATGEVHFYFDGTTASTSATITGLSHGNAIAAVPGVDLTGVMGNSGTTQLLFEQFPANTIDLANKFIHFAPNVFGGYDETSTDCGAFNRTYGAGCYQVSDSFYQHFANAAVASTALTGQSLTLTPTGLQYTVTWGGGVFIPPTPAAVEVFAAPMDDGEVVVTPSLPFATPTGPVASVRVHSNGIISWGASAQTFPGTSSYTPTANGFLDGGNAGIYAWHDYNETEAGSGRIKREEIATGTDTVLCVTWDGVENYSTPASANPGTMQFQLNLTSGVVVLVWPFVDGNVTSAYGSAHLVGYSPAGASIDDGGIVLATALPLVTQAENMPAMTLSASPAPISTGVSGTVVTYTTENMPEYGLGTGTYIGLNVISLGQVANGLELIALGAPRCYAYVASLDVTQAMIGTTPTQSVTLSIPPLVPPGYEFYSQSVTMVAPFSLPNGMNAYGMTVSNGVRQRIDTF
ncbi:MAG TPA: hypothetical protein VFZ65_13295 [Planctomycetota bacterium]|nr:hypothetical protein [Planctomycetota bacterium]